MFLIGTRIERGSKHASMQLNHLYKWVQISFNKLERKTYLEYNCSNY